MALLLFTKHLASAFIRAFFVIQTFFSLYWFMISTIRLSSFQNYNADRDVKEESAK